LFILQVAAQAGQKVVVVDVEQKVLDKAQNAIKVSLQRVAKKQFKVIHE
jgi:3-hydroxyacyl-CoA dehydrogenase